MPRQWSRYIPIIVDTNRWDGYADPCYDTVFGSAHAERLLRPCYMGCLRSSINTRCESCTIQYSLLLTAARGSKVAGDSHPMHTAAGFEMEWIESGRLRLNKGGGGDRVGYDVV